MRVLPSLLPLCLLLVSCRSYSHVERHDPPRPVMSLPEAAAAMARGSGEGEARLAAAGPDAAPYLKVLLESPEPEVRRRALRLLVDSGEDIDLSVPERVDLLLAEIVRDESPPYSSLRALAELQEMGPEADPALEVAAAREGPEGEAARRLLFLRAR